MCDRAKDLKIAELSDYYKGLLTEKQYEIFDLYYNLDYSLAEVSENLGITRQSVRDCLLRCRELILNYEERLKLFEKTSEVNRLCAEALELCKEPEIKNILNRIVKVLEV